MIKFKTLSWDVRSDCVSADAFGMQGFYVIVGTPGHWDLRYPSGIAMYYDQGHETQHAAREAAQVDFQRRVLQSIDSESRGRPG